MTRVDLRSAKPDHDGPLLRLDDLSVRFEAEHNEWIEAVRHVSFDLHAGERFALVGESARQDGHGAVDHAPAGRRALQRPHPV